MTTMDDDEPPSSARSRFLVLLAAVAVAIFGVGEVAPSLTAQAVAPLFDDSPSAGATTQTRAASRRVHRRRRACRPVTCDGRSTLPPSPSPRWRPHLRHHWIDPPRRGPPLAAVPGP